MDVFDCSSCPSPDIGSALDLVSLSTLQHKLSLLVASRSGEFIHTSAQALVAKSEVNWTYAILWRLSTQAEGHVNTLKWGDGYFNVAGCSEKSQSKQLDEDQLLRRKVLWELHDLCNPNEEHMMIGYVSDQEWFYLLSMSWSFPIGKSVPGEAFQTGEHVWISETSKVTGIPCERLELAKAYGIQTLVCVPTSFGVIELGSTETVNERPGIVQEVKRYFKDVPDIQQFKSKL